MSNVQLPTYRGSDAAGLQYEGLLTQCNGLYYITLEHKSEDGDWLHHSQLVDIDTVEFRVPGAKYVSAVVKEVAS